LHTSFNTLPSTCVVSGDHGTIINIEVYEFSCRHGIGSTHLLLLADKGKPLSSTKRKERSIEGGREVPIMAVYADVVSCRVTEPIPTTVNKHVLLLIFAFYCVEFASKNPGSVNNVNGYRLVH
jgi:hypothetical protein